MKKKIYISLFLVLVVFISGAHYYIFRKSPDSVEKSKPDFYLEAVSLFNEFSEDENLANQKYLDKTLQVKGMVIETGVTQNNIPVVYLEGSLMGNISCTFGNEKSLANQIEPGQSVTVKGKCTGFIMDVVLTKCVLVD